MSARIVLIACLALTAAPVRGASASHAPVYPDPSLPLVAGLLSRPVLPEADTLAGDSLTTTDLAAHPDYKYPGRTMMMSLLIPGSGQLLVQQPLKGLAYLSVDVLALMANRQYRERGATLTQTFKDSADIWWDLGRWVWEENNFQAAPWLDLGIGLESGSHQLLFYVDVDNNQIPDNDFVGNSKDDADTLRNLLANVATRNHVYPIRSQEYYENIGKYNQFFSGWDDADPDNPDIEVRESGLDVAYSPHRRKYLQMRFDANRVKSTANYAISVLLFNHVVSAIDAIFATSRWNRGLAADVSARLWYHPDRPLGIGGVQLSLEW